MEQTPSLCSSVRIGLLFIVFIMWISFDCVLSFHSYNIMIPIQARPLDQANNPNVKAGSLVFFCPICYGKETPNSYVKPVEGEYCILSKKIDKDPRTVFLGTQQGAELVPDVECENCHARGSCSRQIVPGAEETNRYKYVCSKCNKSFFPSGEAD